MLLLALLIARGRQVVYVPGRTVNRMSGAYQGESKTDARVIADQARMRPRDFQYLDTPPEPVTTHRILTDYRADLIAPPGSPDQPAPRPAGRHLPRTGVGLRHRSG